jgi:hypothetical protein
MVAYLRRLLHRRHLPNKTCCSNPSQPPPTKPIKVVNNFLGTISNQQRATTPEECTLTYVTPKRTNKLIYSKTPCSLHTQHQKMESFTNWRESSGSSLEDQCCCCWWETLKDFCTLIVYSWDLRFRFRFLFLPFWRSSFTRFVSADAATPARRQKGKARNGEERVTPGRDGSRILPGPARPGPIGSRHAMGTPRYLFLFLFLFLFSRQNFLWALFGFSFLHFFSFRPNIFLAFVGFFFPKSLWYLQKTPLFNLA